MSVVPYKKYPVRITSAWDAGAAVKRLAKWASQDGSGDKDKMKWQEYEKGFGVYDSADRENFGSYKYPHHDIVDGEIVTDSSGVVAALQRVDSGDMTATEKTGLRAHLERHQNDIEKAKESQRVITLYHPHASEIRAFGYMPAIGDQRAYEVGDDNTIAHLFAERVGLPDIEQVFVFSLRPSTQALDSYGTRMSAQALEKYAKSAIDGTPFMNSHRTGGWFTGAELPLGYSFDGAIFGNAVDETPLLNRDVVPQPDAINLMEQGVTLRTWDYMVKGYYPNGKQSPGTDDIILGIAGRSIRSISIGFMSARGRRMRYVCGLCGSVWGSRDDCGHYPFVQDRKTGLPGFAWVYDSDMYEHSAVWAGATPGAIVERVVLAASRGMFSGEEIDNIEEKMGQAIKRVPTFYFENGGKMDEEKVIEETEADAVVVEPEAQAAAVTSECDCAGDNSLGEVLARLSDIGEVVDDLRNRLTSMEARGNLDDGDNISRQEQALIADLVDQAIKARVRAIGPAGANRYEKQLSAMSVDEIRAEIQMYDDLTAKAFVPGRVAAGASREGDNKKSQGREDPSLYKV